MKKYVCFVFFLLVFSKIAYAYETIVGHVTVVEPSYLPQWISFQLDTGSASCPAGTWLTWKIDAATGVTDTNNNQAVYSTLLAAISQGRYVWLFVNDGDTTCVGRHLHLRNN